MTAKPIGVRQCQEKRQTLRKSVHLMTEIARFHRAPMERKVAQNIYDHPEFFANYSQLARSVHGLDGAPEWLIFSGH
jgi:hypothetical protein